LIHRLAEVVNVNLEDDKKTTHKTKQNKTTTKICAIYNGSACALYILVHFSVVLFKNEQQQRETNKIADEKYGKKKGREAITCCF